MILGIIVVLISIRNLLIIPLFIGIVVIIQGVWGYLKKQNADILAFKRDENLIIPENMDYDKFSGLSIYHSTTTGSIPS